MDDRRTPFLMAGCHVGMKLLQSPEYPLRQQASDGAAIKELVDSPTGRLDGTYGAFWKKLGQFLSRELRMCMQNLEFR